MIAIPFELKQVELCGNCHGTGTTARGVCPVCDGAGRVWKIRKGTVEI